MPYTVLGAMLMIYSQSRLVRGQHLMAKQAKAGKLKPKKTRRWKRISWKPEPATAAPAVQA
jgi:hypothetical protein